MDFNGKNSGKRKAQSIQDMINNPQSSAGNGIRKSSYSGPKSMGATSNTMDLSGININRSDVHDRWGNSNDGMPKPKKERYKADVANPMRGNVLKKEMEQSNNRLNKKAKDIDRERKSQQSRSASSAKRSNTGSRADGRARQYVAPAARGPLDEFGWIILSAMLFLCVIVTLISSGVKPRSSGYKYPMNVITISGVVNTAYEHAMGINGTFSSLSVGDSQTSVAGDASEEVASTGLDGNTKQVEKVDENSLNDLGEEGNAATLDDGTMSIPGVTPATSHAELIEQVKTELAAGNTSFISSKIAYADESTGELNAYPMSVIKHFCEYMVANPDKLNSFISAVSSEEYSGQNGSAFVIKLPVMKFTIKMGESTPSFPLDNTVVSVSGFTDVIVNGNQNAAIYPLLPCIYTVTLTNNAWPTPSQSQEVEATLGEGDLAIKVGKSGE